MFSVSRRPRFNALLGVLVLAYATAASAVPAPVTAPAPAVSGMVGVDFSKLTTDEASDLIELFKQGICPCDAKSSLYDCVQARKCDKATELARFGADRFREGLSEDQVREAVVRKYFDDFKTFAFDLSNTPRKGAEKPKVVIVEFADFECPHCALVSRSLTEVVKAYPKDVAVYYKHFPLPMHTDAEVASRASFAAHQQGKFWPMHDLIFANQTALGGTRLEAFATEIGLNLARFKVEMNSVEAAKLVDRDKKEGEDSMLTGTPTLYINGKLYHDEKTTEAIKAHVKKLLATPKGKAVR